MGRVSRGEIWTVELVAHPKPRPALGFAKCESLGPIHKSRLKWRIGSLPAGSWAAVEEGVKRVLGLEG